MQDALHRLVKSLESDPSLFIPDQLQRRLQALDALDALYAWDPTSSPGKTRQDLAFRQRATELSAAMEALNETVYASIRTEIQQGDGAAAVLRWADRLKPAKTGDEPVPGMGYDWLDELIRGVLAFREPEKPTASLHSEMVFYQPTPARHILQLIDLTSLTRADVLIDLGSGLGHVALMVAVCTQARSLGIELETSYVACARECGERLRLRNLSFVPQDARTADLSTGTVFYLHTPFTGCVMRTVLDRLRAEAQDRRIRICTYGPCAAVFAGEQWLESATAPQADKITLFVSRI